MKLSGRDAPRYFARPEAGRTGLLIYGPDGMRVALKRQEVIAALIGLYGLDGMPEVLGAVMLFSAGGILYLIFEDVAPQVPLQHAWAPPMGAVLGFMLGLAGHLALA